MKKVLGGLTLFVAIPLLCEGISALDTSPPFGSIDEVQTAIDAGKVLSADDIIARLPPEMTQAPVLAPYSPAQPASIQWPRVVMAKSDGTFFTAFVTNKKTPQYSQMEFAQINSRGEVDLYLYANSRLTLNPPECMVCHQMGDRVVIHPEMGEIRLGLKRHLRAEGYYPGWQGYWLGNFQRRADDSEDERIRAFLENAPNIDRLRISLEGDFKGRAHRANLRFLAIATATEARLLFAELKKQPLFSTLKFALTQILTAKTKLDPKPFSSIDDLMPLEWKTDLQQKIPALQKKMEAASDSSTTFLTELYRKLNLPLYSANTVRISQLKWEPLIFLEWLLNRGGDTLRSYSSSGAPKSLFVEDSFGGTLSYLQILLIEDIQRTSGLKWPFAFSTPPFFDDFPKSQIAPANHVKRAEEYLRDYLRKAHEKEFLPDSTCEKVLAGP